MNVISPTVGLPSAIVCQPSAIVCQPGAIVCQPSAILSSQCHPEFIERQQAR